MPSCGEVESRFEARGKCSSAFNIAITLEWTEVRHGVDFHLTQDGPPFSSGPIRCKPTRCSLTRIIAPSACWPACPGAAFYANMRAAVDRVGRGKERQVNARFSAMVSRYLCDADFCNPAPGWEKGRDKRGTLCRTDCRIHDKPRVAAAEG